MSGAGLMQRLGTTLGVEVWYADDGFLAPGLYVSLSPRRVQNWSVRHWNSRLLWPMTRGLNKLTNVRILPMRVKS